MSLPHPKAYLRPTSSTRRASRRLAISLLPLTLGLCLAGNASAQIFANPDWKESEVPPPPAFDARRMVEIDMPRMMDLKYGVDPDTIKITGDGVVRYVVIASRAGQDGAMNAFYEGLRCATGEAKTYARYSGDAWHKVENPEWLGLNQTKSRHTLALAKQAVCRSGAPRDSVREMVQVLKKPVQY